MKDLEKSIAKRVICSILSGILVVGTVQAAEFFSFKAPEQSYDDFINSEGIKIFVNGRYVEFNDDLGYPIAIDGRTYVPARVISETINAYVDWYERWQEITVSKHGELVVIRLGENNIKKGNIDPYWIKEKKEMDAVAFAKDGRTYVPFRALFEAFDMNVTWDGTTQTIYATGDYTANTECIDFKSYKVFGIKDIDIDKNYRNILYDGQAIDKNYIAVLQNCDDYKVLEDGDTLNIFSYQYLFDLNYIYRAYIWYKNNKTGGYWDEYGHPGQHHDFFISNDAEKTLLDEIAAIDCIDLVFPLRSEREYEHYGCRKCCLVPEYTPEEYIEIDCVADEIVNRVNSIAKSDTEKVAIINDELCRIMDYYDAYRSLYGSLVSPQNGVCGSYALAFKYLMDKLGIDCIVASGGDDGEGHAWNEVLTDGEWKIVDVTFNDTGLNNNYLLVDFTEETSGTKQYPSGKIVDIIRYIITLNDETISDSRTTTAEERIYEQLAKYTLKLNNAD